jgi:hypothetical protein
MPTIPYPRGITARQTSHHFFREGDNGKIEFEVCRTEGLNRDVRSGRHTLDGTCLIHQAMFALNRLGKMAP